MNRQNGNGNMSTAIAVKQVSKVYDIYENPMARLTDALGLSKKNHGRKFYALDHIDFEVEKGKTLGIIGENGAGKSTLLKIITGVLAATEGEVLLDGRVSALLELGTGFNLEYTGIENIYLNGNIMGFDRQEIEKKVQPILEFADIGDYAYQKVKTYSSGMFARLAFATAVHVEPEILIVDEALSVGDLFFQQKCNRYMKEKMSGCTKLLVTHDMASIANMADEVVVISKGRQVFYGEPLQAIEYYTKKVHTELYQVRNPNNHADRKGLSSIEQHAAGHQVWNYIDESALGGALEARFLAFDIRINYEAYKGYVYNEDTVIIHALIETERAMDEVIIGYQVKDKYGNVIFGENTHSSGFAGSRINIQHKSIAKLVFQWPKIQENNYFLTLGLGEGTHETQHVIQCWAHNIFQFQNISRQPNHGLFNNKIEQFQMREIEEK